MKKIITRKKCKCDGEMKATGMAYSNSVATYYTHKCSKCRTEAHFNRLYPDEHFEFTKKEIKEVWE